MSTICSLSVPASSYYTVLKIEHELGSTLHVRICVQ